MSEQPLNQTSKNENRDHGHITITWSPLREETRNTYEGMSFVLIIQKINSIFLLK